MSINVLIVDDSRIMRTMILKTLQMTGVSLGEIFQAGNGREGLESLERNWIDLAIVDINMPVMNGEEMIDRVRSNPEMKDLPMVVVSTEGSETRIARLEEKGVVFIHKPFQAETIRDTIVDLLKLEIGDE
jgi:two-component system, chemotaxis family, chemotaxis protein CheY